MAEQHGSRRLTHADVLVIGAVCLLLILLVPVLFAKPREQAVRRVCGANLAQIGKAMLLYADDYGVPCPVPAGQVRCGLGCQAALPGRCRIGGWPSA
jgi:hypothetical protein